MKTIGNLGTIKESNAKFNKKHTELGKAEKMKTLVKHDSK